MKLNDCDSKLEKLKLEWNKDPSFVEHVMERIDEEPAAGNLTASLSQNKGMNMIKLNLVGLLAVVVIGLVFFLPDSGPVSAGSLAAEIRKAVSQQDSVHIVRNYHDNETGEQGKAESWFVRGKGYATTSTEFVEIDDGTHYWRHAVGSMVATKTKTRNLDKSFKSLTFPESDYKRNEADDLTIDGKKMACYERLNLAPYADGPQRSYLYVDSNNRIYKLISWKFKNEKWNQVQESFWYYNVTVDERMFKPEFDESIEIIDLDEEIDQLVNLETSLFRKTVMGFDYAVHQARPLIGGGVSLLVSVRPSESKKPSGITATIYDASPQFNNDFRIEMGNTRHDHIHAQWFIRVPRDEHDSWNNIENGILRIEETISLRDMSDMSINGHKFQQIPVELAISNDEAPISLEQAAIGVHRDQIRLPNIGYKTLDMGVYLKDDVPYGKHGSVERVDESAFAASVIEHLRYWRQGDEEAKQQSMEREIESGEVKVSFPGLSVSGYAAFGDEQLARACKRQDLVQIRANNTSITDAGLTSLVDLTQLKELSINGTSISDEGLVHLKNIDSLKRLKVRGTKITAQGINRLRSALPDLEVESDFE